MRRIALLVSFALAAPASAEAPTAPAPATTEETFCSNEVEMVARRRRLFEREGLPEEEVVRRNTSQLRALVECRERLRSQQREADAAQREAEDIARRAGPNATEKERAATRRVVRLERLSAKSPSSLTREERAELAEGMKEEMVATHAALDRAHARDRGFMRVVHSALACYHVDRKEALENQIASEETLLKLGTGDKQALYGLQSELRHSDAVVARSREFGRGHALGLEPCGSSSVPLLVHCIGVQHEGKPALAACEGEDMQQYLRFAK
jgi:hypothetical protein